VARERGCSKPCKREDKGAAHYTANLLAIPLLALVFGGSNYQMDDGSETRYNTITTTTQVVTVPSRLAKLFTDFFCFLYATASSSNVLCPSVAIARTHTPSFRSGGFVGIYSIHPYAKESISNSK